MSWSALPSFKSYFGSALHGATITWYNDPNTAATTSTDNTELKIKWVQNLHSRLYTWYDSTNTNDAKFFVGNYALDSLSNSSTPPTYTETKSGTPAYANSDIVFHMQFANPVTSATPTYDGFHFVATTTITWTDGSNPTGSIAWDTTADTVQDLVPTGDYDKTLDTGGCTSGQAGQYEQVTHPDGNMCTEFWNIGEEGYACVKVDGRIKRTMAAQDASCDIAIDYVSHAIKIQIGANNESDTGFVRFSSTVDFNVL